MLCLFGESLGLIIVKTLTRCKGLSNQSTNCSNFTILGIFKNCLWLSSVNEFMMHYSKAPVQVIYPGRYHVQGTNVKQNDDSSN